MSVLNWLETIDSQSSPVFKFQALFPLLSPERPEVSQIITHRSLAGSNPCGSFFIRVDGITVLYFLFTALAVSSAALYLHSGRLALIPHSSKIYILGTIIGLASRFWNRSDSIMFKSIEIWRNLDPDIILYVLLPMVLFQVVMNVNAHVFSRSWSVLLFIGIMFVIIMTTILAFSLYLGAWYEFPLVTWWIFATALSFTDPIGTEALSLNLELSQKLKTLMIGESQIGLITSSLLFKPLFYIRSGVVNNKDPIVWLKYAAREPLIAIVMGIALGSSSVLVLQETSDRTSLRAMFIQASTIASLSFSTFLIVENNLGSSGLLASFTVAYVVASYGWPLFASRTLMKHMRVLIAFIVSNLMFMQTGLVIGDSIYAAVKGGPFGWKDVSIAALLNVLILCARIFVLVPLRPMVNKIGSYYFSPREMFILAWSGMPGSASMMFILLLASQIEDDFESSWLVFITGLVILMSQVVQGFLLMPIMDLIGMGRKKGLETGLESFAMGKYRRLTAKSLRSELASADKAGYDIENIKNILQHLQCFKDAELDAKEVPLVSSNRNLQVLNEEAPGMTRLNPLKNQEEEDHEEAKMFLKNLKVKSSKKNRTPSYKISTALHLYSRKKSTNNNYSSAYMSSTGIDEEQREAILTDIRTIFLKSLRATYWNQIRNGTIPKGTTTARSMLGATEICLDRVDVSIADFEELGLPEVGLHGSRFKQCVDISLSKVEKFISYCFPALFQDLASRTVHGAIGEAAFRATCLISGHMYARTTLARYVLNESKSYLEAREIMEAAVDKIPELSCVLEVFDESQTQIDQAKEYLKEMKEYAPDVVAVVETKKIISMVLEEQRTFAKQLHEQGILSDHHHHDLVVFLREDQRKLKRMKIGPAFVDLRKESKSTLARKTSAISLPGDGDVLINSGSEIVDIDVDRDDFFEKIKEEAALAKGREKWLNKILPAEEQEASVGSHDDDVA